MSYTNQVNLENLLKRELTDEEGALLSLVFDAVDKFIDEKIGGSFGAVSATSRYYDSNGGTIIDIDPCYDITSVQVVDNDRGVLRTYNITTDREIELRPINDDVKRWIELRYEGFGKGLVKIKVTGKFSLGDVPSDIEYLATYLASKFFNDYHNGNIESESIEGYSRKFSKMGEDDFIVTSILDKYSTDEIFF